MIVIMPIGYYIGWLFLKIDKFLGSVFDNLDIWIKYWEEDFKAKKRREESQRENERNHGAYTNRNR